MLESFVSDRGDGARWSTQDLRPPIFKQAAELFQDGFSVRQVAAALNVSKTEAGRLRLRALLEGLIPAVDDTPKVAMNGHGSNSLQA
jgi:hypothetical protein